MLAFKEVYSSLSEMFKRANAVDMLLGKIKI